MEGGWEEGGGGGSAKCYGNVEGYGTGLCYVKFIILKNLVHFSNFLAISRQKQV